MKYKIEITEQITSVNIIEGTDEQDAINQLLETDRYPDGSHIENITHAETIETIITPYK